MKEYFLPETICSPGQLEKNIITVPYTSHQNSLKTRIILNYHLFSFLSEGEKIVSYASGTKSINNEQFLFLPAGNCLMSEKVASNGRYKSTLLFVSKQALKDFFFKIPCNTPSDLVKHIGPLDVRPKAFKMDEYLKNYLLSLHMAVTDITLSDEMLNLKFDELMIYLLRQDESLIQYFKALTSEWDEDAYLRRLISIHMDTEVTVEELAFLSNMSLSTFKRKFAKVFGDAPKQWFLKTRMQKAADMLKTDGLKASEIYENLGYDNLSSFVQAFKKVHGVTPKQYQLT